jgi:hypothetical protein
MSVTYRTSLTTHARRVHPAVRGCGSTGRCLSGFCATHAARSPHSRIRVAAFLVRHDRRTHAGNAWRCITTGTQLRFACADHVGFARGLASRPDWS